MTLVIRKIWPFCRRSVGARAENGAADALLKYFAGLNAVQRKPDRRIAGDDLIRQRFAEGRGTR